jgi:hypothetical protein
MQGSDMNESGTQQSAVSTQELAAAERAYCAFVEAIKEFSPPVVQTWSEMHARVRAAWIAAAKAARSDR